ncbi:protein transport protein SFT2-like [Lytechinus variegatus]|uniref:protein transport protein SFT2-like n=1 Tax=Lytechinus variegatus TaxID=7654 RepID=UPI001BB1F866|nr:protein transport protein SFT2-like [Lytechinus variegatus]XP_041479920.1 protein transport protein SFT2-like [Lytechinus variegatus]
MADLKSDLQSYLSSSSKSLSQSSSSLSSGAKNTMNSMTSWFSGSKNSQDDVEATGNLLTGAPKDAAKDGGDSNGWFTQAEKDPLCPSLNRQQRIMGFVGCLLAGVFCFVLAWTFAPLIVVKPRKFALLYTLGSLFSVSSFSLLWGPMNHLKHLCSAQRFPFTATYFGTMFATLYFSMIKQVTIMTIVCAILQMLALIWYVMSYIPGGQTGLKFFTKVFTSLAGKAVSSSLPV